MSPTSRNSMIVGGGLIVVALLFTCGPMQSWFSQSDAGAPETPPVVVAPVVAPAFEPADSLAAATAGAVAGADVGAASAAAIAADDASGDSEGIAVVAPVVAAAGAAGAVAAAAATPGSGGGSGVPVAAAAPPPPAALPAVSAGAPIAPVVLASAAAAGSFDNAFGDDLGSAGKAVDRFAPPVAGEGGTSLAAAIAGDTFGVNSGSVRQPCDSPGSGCRNLRGLSGGGDGGGGPIPPRINPPIIPGVRPVP
jgi:hypothetical protein